jgi:hypothetical protein
MRVLLMMTVVCCLGACATAPDPVMVPVDRDFAAKPDEIWGRAARLLSDRGFEIRTANREAGVILAEKVFGGVPAYLTCENDIGLVIRSRTKLTLSLSVVPAGEGARVRVKISGDQAPMAVNGPLMKRACYSTGALEGQLLDSLEAARP